MEKYAEIIKAMAICAGPDCNVSCPYHGKSLGGKSCRTALLEDAMQALVYEEDRADAAEETVLQVRAHRDAIESDRADITRERDVARKALAEWQEAGVRDKSEIKKLNDDIDDLEAAINTIRTERDGLKEYALALEKEGQEARARGDKLNQELTCIIQHRDELAADANILRERCQVQQNEINALVLKLGSKQGDKTDRPSVGFEEMEEQIGKLVAAANYQQGRADTLAEIVKRCSFGGGVRHD